MADKAPPKNAPQAGGTAPPPGGKPVTDQVAGGAPAPAEPPPELDAKTRVDQLRADVEVLAKEVKILEGRLKNRDPAALVEIKKENNILQARKKNLERALYVLLADALVPRQAGDLESEYESLRQAAVNWFKSAGIEESLWKDIGS